jgi:ABC-type nickel/cobalt efflux system permease component RcnA
LLIVSVAVVGVPHTIVPDHWAPITLIVRQRGWSKGETACAALQAGIGHVVSTLIIASVIWFAGVAVAARFGHFIDTAASVALVAFGGWIAISSWRELRRGAGHGHSHGHDHTPIRDPCEGFAHPWVQQLLQSHLATCAVGPKIDERLRRGDSLPRPRPRNQIPEATLPTPVRARS